MKFEKIISKLSSHNVSQFETAEIINQFNPKNKTLPIEAYTKEFYYSFESSSTLIVIGETGCGKTTKIPELLLKANDNIRIAHILPRKIACVMIAEQVSKNMNLTLGKEIGYSIRFDYNYNSKETKCKFLTEGMFLRELLLFPTLDLYNTIIIDDCHEKSIHTEIILAFLKLIQIKRGYSNLKIIISSATIDYQNYMNYFLNNNDPQCKVSLFHIPGRNYPVDIYYLSSPCENYIKQCLITVLYIQKYYVNILGDILVFLPGIEEINEFVLFFEQLPPSDSEKFVLCQLSASMPSINTLEIFKPCPSNKRKIIVSTNIAEASITIENLSFVIDCCFTKMKFYNYKTDTEHMLIIPASQSSLNQRAGRAGRTRPGKCFRMITEQKYNHLDKITIPEIKRSNLREFILILKSFGIQNLSKINLMTKYDEMIFAKAIENLFVIGIIDKETKLTNDIGMKVCDMPIDCRYATSLIYSGIINSKFNCVNEILAIVSMLSVNNLFYQRVNPEHIMKAKQSKGMIEGDHLTLLSIFKIFKSIKNKNMKLNFCKEMYLNYQTMKEVEKINDNLKIYLKKYKININKSIDQDGEDILKCLMKGFILNIAHRNGDNSYELLRKNNESNLKLYIHPTSVLYTILPEFVLFDDVIVTKQCYMRNVSSIKKEWIEEVCGDFYENKTNEEIQKRFEKEVEKQQQIETNNVNEKFVFGGSKFCFKKNESISHRGLKIINNESLHNNNINDDIITFQDETNVIKEDEIENITMLRRKRNKNKKII